MAVPVIWSDLNQKLVGDGAGGILLSINADSVATSVDNILRTRPGERVMLCSFADNLHGILFEPITNEIPGLVAREVKRVIERWDNRLNVLSVTYTPNPDYSQIQLGVVYQIQGLNLPVSQTITLQG